MRASSTTTRDFCVALVYSNEQASICPSQARSDSDNGRNDGCAGVAATGGTRRAHNCIPAKDILLLADSNYITWVYAVLSLDTTSCVKSGKFANTSVSDQRTSELSFAVSKCADTRSPRSAEPVCFPASHRALSHMKPRGSFAATVLTERKTLLEGSADLEHLHQAIRRGILLSGRASNFSLMKCISKKFSVQLHAKLC